MSTLASTDTNGAASAAALFHRPTRLHRAVTAMRARMDALPADVRTEALAAVERTAAIDAVEHAAWQELKSAAQGSIVDLDEAHLIYEALGSSWSPANGGWASDTDLATKVVVTQVMAEIAKAL